MDCYEILEQLDRATAVSGHEYAGSIGGVVESLLRPYCTEVSRDALGNIIGVMRCGIEHAPSLLLEAHQDELGLIVSGVTEEGSLLFQTLGGFDPKVLPGSEVTVHGKEPLFGVIGAVPPHLGGSKNLNIDEMAVDIGFSAEQTKEKVSIGDLITINTSYTRLCGSMVAARCLDDRAGIAAIVLALEKLARCRLSCDIIAVATVQEELGLRGARTMAQALLPTAAIAIDVCHGTSPTVSDNAFPCGKGVVVSVGPNLHPRLTRALLDCAKQERLDVQIDVDSGDTGTDAWEIQVAGCGVPVALLSLPVRYMHGNYEVLDAADVTTTANLIAAYAAQFTGGDALCY